MIYKPKSQKDTPNLSTFPAEHKFYVQLVILLSPLFPNIEVKKLNSLSTASYRYFKFLLSFDEFIDSKNVIQGEQQFLNLKNGFVDYEQSICSLAYLFPAESSFWNYFQICKNTYFETVLLEKTLSKSKEPISETLFEKLAMGKSSVCLNVVYALQALGECNTYEFQLIEILNQIHISFQLLDDIDDFKKDIGENQWTYPQYLLQEYLAENDVKEVDNTLKHKYLYISGIVEGCLQKVIIHFEKALEIVELLELNDLKKIILDEIKKVETFDKSIKLLIKKAYKESK